MQHRQPSSLSASCICSNFSLVCLLAAGPEPKAHTEATASKAPSVQIEHIKGNKILRITPRRKDSPVMVILYDLQKQTKVSLCYDITCHMEGCSKSLLSLISFRNIGSRNMLPSSLSGYIITGQTFSNEQEWDKRSWRKLEHTNGQTFTL